MNDFELTDGAKADVGKKGKRELILPDCIIDGEDNKRLDAAYWRSRAEAAEARLAERDAQVAALTATLDGDPHQTATPEQRRAWRASAIRYADKLEAQVAALQTALQEANEDAAFHPRAAKLMRKRKNFIVIACDESYFMDVYDLIRDSEMQKGTWTIEDQWHYDDAKVAHRARVGGA